MIYNEYYQIDNSVHFSNKKVILSKFMQLIKKLDFGFNKDFY